MKNKNEIQDELRELSPLLAQRKGMDEGFQVPKDYFRSLPEEVLKRVRQDPPSPVQPQRNWMDGVIEFLQNIFQPRYALAYASVAVLVAAGVYFWGNGNEAAQPLVEAGNVELEAIPDEAIENYLAENLETVSTELLETHFAEGSSQQLPALELEEMESYLDNYLDDLDLSDLEDLL